MSGRARNLILAGLALAVVLAMVLATREPGTTPRAGPERAMRDQPTVREPSTRDSATAADHSHPPPPAPQAGPVPGAVPPYRTPEEIRRGPLPQPMAASYFRGYPPVERAYQVAARIPEVLAEQPCYCWCDKFGHGSLLDCFATDHGAG
jgi:hypothetical protein